MRASDPSLARRAFLARSSALALASFGSLASLAGCGSSQATLERLAPDAVILAFGDSLTFGTGAGNGQSYPAQLERLVGRKVIAAGVPGEVSAAGLARLPGVLDQVQPRLVILCHGGNDFLRRLPDAQVADNLRAMIRVARQHGANVMLVGVPKPGFFPSAPDFYADIASEFAIPYEEKALKKILTDNALKADLIHPNAAGYAQLAGGLAELLRKSGAV